MSRKIALLLFFLVNFSSAFSQILNPLVDSIPMRDGKKLAADIYLPAGAGPWPTILIQTPYNRQLYRFGGLPIGIHYAVDSMNYSVIILDWRGFYGSAAALNGVPERGEDGFDAVTWITLQTWSDGKVGTWGPSALGRVQYLTARENPPGLICAAPLVAAPQYNYLEYFPGGVYRTEYVEQLDALGFGMSTLLLAHPVKDIIWDITEANNMYPDEIHIPLLMIGGWYDHNINVMVEWLDSLNVYGDPAVKDKHRLLVGPWAHGGSGIAQVGTAIQGELNYPLASGWSDSLAMNFFDYYLRNQSNGWNLTSQLQYFQMGDDTWNSDSIWPPENVPEVNFYLRQGGSLKFSFPTETGAVSPIIYDPRDPSPTVGGPTLRSDLDQGPYDQAAIVEGRNDILIFESDSLTFPIVLKGKPRLHLFVSSDRYDTDFAVRLTDVYPDGRSMIFADGIFRMRFLNSWYSTDSIQPGVVYEIDIDLQHTGITILPGHRLRLDITSSNYPRFDANLNNGGLMYTAGDSLIANNQIFFNPLQPSCLVLPMENATVSIDPSKGSEISFMEIFPVPADEEIFLRFREGMPRPDFLILSDFLGKIFLRLTIDAYSEVLKISTASLPDGLYFIKARGRNSEESLKFTVIHE